MAAPWNGKRLVPASLVRFLRRTAALALLALLPPYFCSAQAIPEYEVKAAFLLNFTKFVDWPPAAFADPAAPFAICILGPDPFGHVLDEVVAGETLGGHRLIVRRLEQAPAAQICQLVFVGESNKDSARILNGMPHGVLTVGEGSGFLRAGGMVAFVVENRRVRFDIRQSAAQSAELKLSSKLLSVARAVEK